MRLTTKGRYAVTAMLDLALHYEQGAVSLSDISARQGISLSYLEQLFSKMRRRGLVNSSRGPGGGYRLSRSASDIFVAEVIASVDEKVDARKCEGKGNCNNETKCLTHDLWCDLSDQIYNFLSQIDLQQLVNREQARGRSCSTTTNQLLRQEILSQSLPSL
ncbi:Rrf2 family transcriptional regulator [Ectothiorhodospiraceae bacterium BW-2]|nr:Rrf2 family transcriptional regulator [Ectothiorhodospiraceae bacterium BW-2]